MITATFRIVVYPERRDEVLKTLRPLIGPTEAEPGCISCRIHQDVDNPNVLTLVEQWDTQADLDKHIASDDFRRILAVLDLSIEPPEIRFDGIAESAGIELIESARKEQTATDAKPEGGWNRV